MNETSHKLIDNYINELEQSEIKNIQLVLSLIESQKENEINYSIIKSRIFSILLINNILNQEKYQVRVNLCHFISDYIDSFIRTFKTKCNIKIVKTINQEAITDVNAQKVMIICLIANELLINAIKYAFPEGCHLEDNNNFKIEVALNKIHNSRQLCISDNGIAMGYFEENKNVQKSALLVNSLIELINGKSTLDMENGRTYKINF